MDTFKYAKQLERSGFTRDQAETTIRMLKMFLDENVATKLDIMELRHTIDSRYQELNTKIDNQGQEFVQIRSEMKQMKYEMIVILGGLMTASLGLAANMDKILSLF